MGIPVAKKRAVRVGDFKAMTKSCSGGRSFHARFFRLPYRLTSLQYLIFILYNNLLMHISTDAMERVAIAFSLNKAVPNIFSFHTVYSVSVRSRSAGVIVTFSRVWPGAKLDDTSANGRDRYNSAKLIRAWS